MKVKNAILYGIFLAFNVLIAALIAEIYLRFNPPQAFSMTFGIKGLYLPDSAVGFRMTPNYEGTFRLGDTFIPFKINRNGLRGHTIDEVAKANYKVVLLGDSFTLGAYAPENEYFAAFFEDFSQKDKAGLKVLNLGHNHNGPSEYFARYKGVVENAFKPDLVILAFYQGNDYGFTYDLKNTYRVSADGMLMYRGTANARSFHDGLLYGIWESRRKLYLYQVLASFYRSFHRPERKLYDEHIYGKHYFSSIRAKDTFALFMEMKNYFASQNIDFMILNLPVASQIYPEDWVENSYIRQKKLDLNLPSRILKIFCDENAVPLHDLVNHFQVEASKSKSRLFNDKNIDNHFSPEGHRVAARYLYSYVKENFWDKAKLEERVISIR